MNEVVDAPRKAAAALTLRRRLAAEALGTAYLLAAVVGSGIMADRLAGGNVAIALLGNTLATGAALIVLILVFGPISGAHFNPAVTVALAWRGEARWTEVMPYVAAQLLGALLGLIAAHVMFEAPLLAASLKARTGAGQWLGEFVATFGLLATILGTMRSRPAALPYAVGLYIAAGYWFTSSTSFANPVVTLARAFTESFSGIRPPDAPAFILAQAAGAAAAVMAMRWLAAEPRRPSTV